MSFQEEVKSRLSVYKKEKLEIQEAGLFRYRGQTLLREHILPIEFKQYNVIQPYRKAFFVSPNSQIDFHRYFHHLNSSQALCVNLFFPLIADNQLDLVLDLIQIPQTPIIETHFEKESDIEIGPGRRTNFDFYMQLSDNTKIYFEIKYFESEFGKANHDEEHRRKYAITYVPLLKYNGFINFKYTEMDSFFESYQIMRNLCHIGDKSYVVFVYPKANTKIHQQAMSAQENILTKQGKSRFRILLLETAVDNIIEKVQSKRLQDHYHEFKAKYFNHQAT